MFSTWYAGITMMFCCFGLASPFPAIVGVSVGDDLVCLVLSGGLSTCWGSGGGGRTGTFSQYHVGELDFLRFSTPSEVTQITPNLVTTCALFQNGRAQCWGLARYAGVGPWPSDSISVNTVSIKPPYLQFNTTDTIVQLSAGNYGKHTCALFSNGKVRCWGDNTYGQLGQGVQSAIVGALAGEVQGLPFITFNSTDSVTQISCGQGFSCALFSTGRLRCWGRGDGGKLGQNAGGNNIGISAGDMESLPFIEFNTTHPITSISSGYGHACAIFGDGSMRCWGGNNHGQLGIERKGASVWGASATHSTSNLPAVPLKSRVIDCSLGISVTCVLLASVGSVKCWGENSGGQLGQGSLASVGVGDEPGEIEALSPIDFGTTLPVRKISCFRFSCCALFEGSRVKCWGSNTAGEGSFKDWGFLGYPSIGGLRYIGDENGEIAMLPFLQFNNTYPLCGNTVLDPGERCDDGNLMSGDGCSAICTVESGFACRYLNGSVCQKCQNGRLEGTEPCDDGNDDNGDGCDVNCNIEPGFQCSDSPLMPSVCTECGNGEKEVGEACDDRNSRPGDGCSATCTIETGYTCDFLNPDWPLLSVCQSCSNGKLEGTEACDDGNANAGDGCYECSIENDFSCIQAAGKSLCSQCGNGRKEALETCDDGNREDGDGCSAACDAIESGFVCAGENPSRCNSCGNGKLEANEGCDDGNTGSGDGCDAACRKENGFTCTQVAFERSVCQQCGNGRREGTEECDDQNLQDRDGCSSGCNIESGYQCTASPSVCFKCGNAKRENEEACDDGNTTPGDGCNGQCQKELGWDCDTTTNPNVCNRTPGFSIVEAMEPDSGPVAGGTRVTVTGRNLNIGGKPYCRLGNSVRSISADVNSDATQVICVVREHAIAEARVFQSIDFALMSGGAPIPSDVAFSFTYYASPSIGSVTPVWAFPNGGLTVTVRGGPFHTASTPGVVFGETPTPCTFNTTSAVLCTTPSHAAGVVALQIGHNYAGGRVHDLSDNATATFEFRPCSPGLYSQSPSSPCLKCPRGQFQPRPGQVECQPCSVFEYAEVEGLAACSRCPNNTETYQGAHNRTSCQCSRNFFHPQGLTGEDCRPCPPGGTCEGSTALPVPSRGYWAQSLAVGVQFLECSNPAACPGGSARNCSSGYAGQVCGECDVGFFRKGRDCVPCPDNARLIFTGFILFAIVLSVALVYVVRRQRSQYMNVVSLASSFFQILSVVLMMDLHWPKSVKESVGYMTLPFTVNLDFLASECSLQVDFTRKWLMTMLIPPFFMCIFAVIYGVLLAYARILRASRNRSKTKAMPADDGEADDGGESDMSNPDDMSSEVDADPRTSPPNEGEGTSKKKKRKRRQLTAAAIGVAARAKMKAGNAVSKLRDRVLYQVEETQIAQIRNAIVNAFCMLISLLYLVLARNTLSFFDCTKKSDGLWYLDVAPSLHCYRGWWWHWLPVAIVAIVVYVLGIPLAVVSTIYRHRNDLNSERTIQRYGSWFQKYKSQHAYWEAVIMVRKLAVVAARSFFGGYPVLQCVLVLATCYIAQVRHTRYKPYLIPRYNQLEGTLLYSAAAVMMGGLLFSAREFRDDETATKVVTVAVFIVIGLACLALLFALGEELVRQIRITRQRGMKGDAVDVFTNLLNNYDIGHAEAWLRQAEPKDQGALIRVLSLLKDRMHDPIAETITLTHESLPTLSAFCQHIFRSSRLPAILQCLLTESASFCHEFVDIIGSIASFKFHIEHKRRLDHNIVGIKKMPREPSEEHARLMTILCGPGVADHDDIVNLTRRAGDTQAFFRLLTQQRVYSTAAAAGANGHVKRRRTRSRMDSIRNTLQGIDSQNGLAEQEIHAEPSPRRASLSESNVVVSIEMTELGQHAGAGEATR